jgi:UDP-N-acetylmuramate--alanine ligase
MNQDVYKIPEIIEKFQGVLHRFTILGKKNNYMVVDDYAHNPKKIETVIRGAKESFPEKYIFVVFQPHRYSRVALQFDDFLKCFYQTDYLCIAPVYGAGELPIPGASSDVLYAHLNDVISCNQKENFFYRDSLEDVAECVKEVVSQKKEKEFIILLLGAGDIRKISKEFIS